MAGEGRSNGLGFEGNGVVQVLHEVKHNPNEVSDQIFREAQGDLLFSNTVDAIKSKLDTIRSQALSCALNHFSDKTKAIRFLQNGILTSLLKCLNIPDSSEETISKIYQILARINGMRSGREKFISEDALRIISQKSEGNKFESLIPLAKSAVGKQYFEENEFYYTTELLNSLTDNDSVENESNILQILYELVDFQSFVFWFCSDLERLAQISKCLCSESPRVKADAAKLIGRLSKFNRAKKSLHTVETSSQIVDVICKENDEEVLKECLAALAALSNELEVKLYCVSQVLLKHRVIELFDILNGDQAKVNLIQCAISLAESQNARVYFRDRNLLTKIQETCKGRQHLVGFVQIACDMISKEP